MALNRRDLLKTLSAGIAAIAVPAVARASADPGFFMWCGWREPANQMITVGWWAVQVRPDDLCRNLLVSTTLGDVRRYRELDVIDLCRSKDWPVIGPWSTEADREALKTRARIRLAEALHA